MRCVDVRFVSGRCVRRRAAWPFAVVVVVAAAFAVGGCSGSASGGGGTDGGRDAVGFDLPVSFPDSRRDTATADLLDLFGGKVDTAEKVDSVDAGTDTRGGCIDNADCDEGYCVPSAQGNVCTRTCVTECEPGWSCRPVGTNPDIVYLCVDLQLVACRPCVDSGACSEPRAGIDGFCVPEGPTGAFCATECAYDEDCPAGYACRESMTTEGATQSACRRIEGECGCTPFSVQHAAHTTCYTENEVGRCDGERRCLADGLTPCSAAEPRIEICDHFDNDCDGQTDEEVADPDAIGDACDDDDDDDGVRDEDDCAPFDPAVGICEDGNPCTEDRCNSAFGLCAFPPRDGACDDDNACTTGDHCAGGACVFEAAVDPDDGDPCTADVCDPRGGVTHTPLEGAVCDDGNPCTAGERCYTGLCAGGTARVCDDGNSCTDDTCVPQAADGCHFTPNTAACDDLDPCTLDDRCAAGTCAPGRPKVCDDGNPCTVDTCDSGSGACEHASVLNGTGCDDGDLCNGVRHCAAGACVEDIPPVDCGAPPSPCKQPRCVPESGTCQLDNTGEGQECGDADPCNGISRCRNGACVDEVPPVTCADDGDLCTEEYCGADGRCARRLVPGCCHVDGDCDDADPCTDDACGETGCTNAANARACHPVFVDPELPPDAPPTMEGAYVLSPWGHHVLDADGRTRMSALDGESFPVFLVDAGQLRLGGVVGHEQSEVLLDVSTTATLLGFLFANGLALPPDAALPYVDFMGGFSAVADLEAVVAASLVAGESPFDPRNAGRILAQQDALTVFLDDLAAWSELRTLGSATWSPAPAVPAVAPRAAAGFRLLAELEGDATLRLTLETHTPRPARARGTRRVGGAAESLFDVPLAPAACCTFGTPFPTTFGAAAQAGMAALDPVDRVAGPQAVEVDVLAPGAVPPAGAAAEYVGLWTAWVDRLAVTPLAGWVEGIHEDVAAGACVSLASGDWLTARSASWDAADTATLSLADETAALLLDTAYARGAFTACPPTAHLREYLEALHHVAEFARSTPTAPVAATFGWAAGDRALPAEAHFTVTDCRADCATAVCGDDLCGGSCGTCELSLNCIAGECLCENTCGTRECGLSPCGEDCGTCAAGSTCADGACVCDPPERVACANDDLYWLDGCGDPVELYDTCDHGCAPDTTICYACPLYSTCCSDDGQLVGAGEGGRGCAGACERCNGLGGCAPRPEGTECGTDGVCQAGVCGDCLYGVDECCEPDGTWTAPSANGPGCENDCMRCGTAHLCEERPRGTDCAGGVCEAGVCLVCLPGTTCCTPDGRFVAPAERGEGCTGGCDACDGQGQCGDAPDRAGCATGAGVCYQGACVDCVPGDPCCTSGGWFVAANTPAPGCDATCEACDGGGHCAAATDGTGCGGTRVCLGGTCKPCLPGATCCTASGDYQAAGQGGEGCAGECRQCDGAGSCQDRPNRASCSLGLCWNGTCLPCEPNTTCCTAGGAWVPDQQQGSGCTGTCQACNGSGACGQASDGTSCNGNMVCVGGACRPCNPGTTCCADTGYFVGAGATGRNCNGSCEECDGAGGCREKPWHTSCGTNRWCEGRSCLDICIDDCSSGQTRCNGSYRQSCGYHDADPCLEYGGDQWCACGCSGGSCNSQVCSSGQSQCSGGNRQVCRSDGCGWDTQSCSCGCSGGSCVAQTCSPGQSQCSGGNRQVCRSDGCGWDTQSCTCGCSGGSCIAQTCSPGSRQCSGNWVQTCRSTGCGWDNTQDCGGCGCSGGSCRTTSTVTLDSETGSGGGFSHSSSIYWWSARDHTDGSADGWFNTGANNANMVYTFRGTGTDWGQWVSGTLCGRFEVQVHIPNPDPFDPTLDGNPPASWIRCTSVTYRVKHDGSPSGQSISSSQSSSGWRSLGTFNFTNRAGEVYMTDSASPSYCAVVFDAVRWVAR